MKRSWGCRASLLPFAVAGALVAGSQVSIAADEKGGAPSSPLTSKSGKLRLFKRDISCAPSGTAERQPLGALLAEPGGEALYPYALGLNSILNLGDRGYAIAVATRALSTGLLKGGGDVMLAGFDRSFNPQWATVFGGPAADGPSSLTRAADGGMALVGLTQSQFFTPMRWLSKGPEVAIVAKFDADGRLEWAQVHQPGDDVGANPVVTPRGGGLAFGGVAWRDGRNAGFLTWLDERGQTKWSRLLGRDFENGVTWIVPTQDGSLLVTGARQAVRPPSNTDPAARVFDIWAAKVGDDGRVLWARFFALASGGARVVASGDRAGGFVIAREPRIDDKAGISRLPVIAIDAQGAVSWAHEFEFDGAVAVSALVDASPDRYLLFGAAVPNGEAGGPFVLEIDRAGRIVDSSWIDLTTAASTPERRVIVEIDPVSVARDDDGSFVLMGGTVEVSAALIAKAKAHSGRMPAELKSDLKSQIYFVRVDRRGRAGACSMPLAARQKPLDVKSRELDLPAVEMPGRAAPFIPIDKLGIERIGPQ